MGTFFASYVFARRWDSPRRVWPKNSRRKETELFLRASTVTFAVTTSTKRYQVVHHVVAELTPAFYVMDLQAFHGTALLTPPTISFQDPVSDYCVFFRVQLEPRLLLT